MILFSDANGTIQANFGTPVYQGSANSNIIYLIAPYAPAASVMVGFQLPDGTAVAPVAMTPQNAIPGVQNESGTSFAGWSYTLPGAVTAKYGTVTAQFFFYAPTGESTNPTSIIATSATSFQIGRGVQISLPGTPDEDIYESILSNLALINSQLSSAYYTARSISPWSNGATYGQNEITFYPSIGTYGAFVQSVISSNYNNVPYINGTLNSAYWKEVVNFNTVTEDYFQQVQEAVAQAESAASEAETQATAAAGSASAALTSAENANQSAQNSAASAEEAERQAGYATNSASAASGYMQGALNAANSALQSKQSAETAAQNAANSATEAQGYAEYTKQLVDGLGGVYIPQGSLAFASLPAQPAAQYQGYVWNITDAFTTDSRFLEGAGESVPAGANVACVLVDGAYKYDVLSGIVDLSNYAQIDGTYSGMTVGKATQADNAATATDSEKLGGVLADEYTLKTGTYPDMTVGNATNAANADTADSANTAQDAAKLGGVAADQYALISQLPTGIIPVSKLPTATEEEYNKHALYLYNDSLSYIVSKTIVVPPGTPAVETLAATLPSARYSTSAAAVGTNCYIFGGYNGSPNYFDEIIQFDTVSQTVTTLSSTLPSARYSTSAAVVDSNCYIFGGISKSTVEKQIIKFDVVSQIVTTLEATLPSGRNGTSAATVGTNCYIFGGNDSSSTALDQIIQFDTVSQTVTTLSSTLPSARYDTCTAAVGTNCYVFGGRIPRSVLDQIIQFDTVSKTVTTLSAILPSRLSNSSVSAIGSMCYLFAGATPFNTNQIIQFDTISQTVTTLSVTLPSAIKSMSASAVGTNCYVFGGSPITDEIVKVTPNGGYSYNEYSYKTLLNQGDITYETV